MVGGLSPAGTVSPIGLARLWCSSRSHAESVSAATAKRRTLARESEDIEYASRGRLEGQVLDRVREAERAGRILGVHVGRDDGTGPAADAGDHGDILSSVGSAIADRLANDSTSGLELPQQLAGARVDRFEPAVHGSVEDEPAGGRE